MRHHKFLQQNCWHIFFHKKNWVLFELNLYLLTSAFSYLVIIILLSLAENSLISLKWIHLCEERDSVLEQLADTILSDCEMNFQRYSHLIHLNRKRIHHRFERVIFCAWCSVYLNTKGWQYFASPTAEMFRDTFRHSHLNSKRISCWSLLCFWKGYFSVVTDISFSCLSLYYTIPSSLKNFHSWYNGMLEVPAVKQYLLTTEQHYGFYKEMMKGVEANYDFLL